MKRPTLVTLLKSALLAAALAVPPIAGSQPESGQRTLNLGKLGNQTTFRLRTTEGQADVDFGLRSDEVITRALLRLRYAYSPSLIESQSHIKVLLNDELVTTLVAKKETAGRPLVQELELDPRLIVDFNRLSFQFVGHYINECERKPHSALWADVFGSSELELTVQPVELKNDLAMLPEPFFDQRDFGRLRLPYVFAANPSYETLRAAGVTASWFGKLAAWRGARFTAHFDAPPKGHAIVFATNKERPAFLKNGQQKGEPEPFTGPAISMLTNPADNISRLLLISGRDARDLKIAVDALVRGTAVLSGPHVAVKSVPQEEPRKAYDAPLWVRLDRPMKFGELVDDPQQLQVAGHVPNVIRLNLRVPPDLFTWKSKGVPVDLKYRYTAPIRASESRLTMAVNDQLVQAMNLRASGQGDSLRLSLPVLEDGMVGERKEILIPPFKVTPRSQLQYAYSFAYHSDWCRDTPNENVRAAVDADSTIDFTGFPHFAEMPHLGYFAMAGFPFTKYADLSQTAVVMPQTPGAADIETMLTLLGRMGESTGYPATQVSVVGPQQESAMKDKDLLLIGTAPNQQLLEKWGDKLPAIIVGENRRISQPVRTASFLYDWFGFGTAPDPEVATEERVQGKGPLAALLGFESPLTSERSVVAITAVEAKHMLQVLDALENDPLARAMHGSAVFVRGDKVESVLAGPTYTIGVIPFWTSIGYWFSQRPALVALLMFIAGIAGLIFLWKLLSNLKKRLTRSEE